MLCWDNLDLCSESVDCRLSSCYIPHRRCCCNQAVLVVVVVAVGVVNVAAVVCSLLCNEPITIEDAK